MSLPDAAGKRRMMTVDFAAGVSPRIGRPRPLFEFDERDLALALRAGALLRRGARTVSGSTRPRPGPRRRRRRPSRSINLIENWLEELKAKVPR